MKKYNDYISLIKESVGLELLKGQKINNIQIVDNVVVINTTNYEIKFPKDNYIIKTTKEIEVFPKVISDEVLQFDGYQIYDKVIQVSPRNKKYEAFIYFPKIGYKFSDFQTCFNQYLFDKDLNIKNQMKIKYFFIML
jgi:hypothetical protein